MSRPRPVAAKRGCWLLDHASVGAAGEKHVEYPNQAEEHAPIQGFDLEEGSIAEGGVRAARRRAHACPVHEGQHVLKRPLVAEALREGIAPINAEGNHAPVALDSICPSATVVSQEQPRGAKVLRTEQTLHLGHGGERPVVRGKLDARGLGSLPSATIHAQPRGRRRVLVARTPQANAKGHGQAQT